MISRRSFIGALFAPAVVRVADLMPIKALAVEPAPLLQFHELPPGIYDLVLTDLQWVEQRFFAEYAATLIARDGEQISTTIKHAFRLPPFNPLIGSTSKLNVLATSDEHARTWVQHSISQLDGVVSGRWESRT